MQTSLHVKKLSALFVSVALFAGCGQDSAKTADDKTNEQTASESTSSSSESSVAIAAGLGAVKASTNTPLPVTEQVLAAAQQNDFRLLATSGRSITIPGLSEEEAAYANKNCGVKLLPSMGDVIKSPEQREQRKKTLAHMKKYNQEMIKMCKKLV